MKRNDYRNRKEKRLLQHDMKRKDPFLLTEEEEVAKRRCVKIFGQWSMR